MRYKLASGREMILGYYSPWDWAQETAARLTRLGCSKEYVAKVRDEIATAEPVLR